MKRLLTVLYQCSKCSYQASVYKGTVITNLHCRKCGSTKNWQEVK